jgi:ankyrin repeat protein
MMAFGVALMQAGGDLMRKSHGEIIRAHVEQQPNHPSRSSVLVPDPAMMLQIEESIATDGGAAAIREAASVGNLDVMRLLLNHPSAVPEAMLKSKDGAGATALMLGARAGQLDAMLLVLDHPSTYQADSCKRTYIDVDRCAQMRMDCDGHTALLYAAQAGELDTVRLLLTHPSADFETEGQHRHSVAEEMLLHQPWGCDEMSALMMAAREGRVEVMRYLLDHPSADPAFMLIDAAGGPEEGLTAFMFAATAGKVEAMQFLLDHPLADAAAMLMQTSHRNVCRMAVYERGVPAAVDAANDDDCGTSALMLASMAGKVESITFLLDHPSANAAAMMMQTDTEGKTAFMLAVEGGQLCAMRVLLDHPCAEPEAMMTQTTWKGATALVLAVQAGRVHAMRVLLDHPSADAADMMAFCNRSGASVLVLAARFAARLPDWRDLVPSCAPLLLLLRRVATGPLPSDAQQAHMSKVMGALCKGKRSQALLDDDGEPDDARDECIRLLIEHGARGYDTNIPAVSRIIRELSAMARVPQRINEAVMGK